MVTTAQATTAQASTRSLRTRQRRGRGRIRTLSLTHKGLPSHPREATELRREPWATLQDNLNMLWRSPWDVLSSRTRHHVWTQRLSHDPSGLAPRVSLSSTANDEYEESHREGWKPIPKDNEEHDPSDNPPDTIRTPAGHHRDTGRTEGRPPQRCNTATKETTTTPCLTWSREQPGESRRTRVSCKRRESALLDG